MPCRPHAQAVTIDVEDLEEDASPEDMMLSYVSADKGKVRPCSGLRGGPRPGTNAAAQLHQWLGYKGGHDLSWVREPR